MTAAERGPVIEARNLRHVFRARRRNVDALSGVDLEVPHGAIFGFLGPNGAGKTTTLRILATLLAPSAGEARVAGHDLRREPREVRRRIGYVSQQGGTDHRASGREELTFQGRLYRLGPGQAARRASELLRLLELEECADRPTSTYSGGQRRRLDIGLGLVHRPLLVFLDEPTTGLDPQGRARMWEEVRRLRAQGTTVFLTTHYLEEADALCDRLAIIDRGRIVSEGTPEELKSAVAGDVVTLSVEGGREGAFDLLRGQPFIRAYEPLDEDGETIRVYVARGPSAVPHIFRVLEGGGHALRSLSVSRPSLDDVFLRQTGRSLREPAA